MHIALKRIENDLNRFLPKGSEEQAEQIYISVRDYYYTLPNGQKEKDRILSLERENDKLKTELKKLKGQAMQGAKKETK